MNHGKRALIIGCGIGGPVAAIALQKAGFEPEVFEAHAGGADGVGTFLNTASNGLAALKTLGVEASAWAAGFPTPRMVMWSGTGKRLGEVANGQVLADGTVSHTIQRGALHRGLRDAALARGMPLHVGKRLARVDELADGVRATFEDGSTAEGAVLVGADGIHSRVRTLLDANAPAPRFTGQVSVGGIARGTKVAPTPGRYEMVFGHRGFFGFSVTPQGDGYWFANAAVATPDEAKDWRRELEALFADDAGPMLELIRGTETLTAYPIFDMPPVPVWHRGRVVLLGDAAHATSPSSGQGASMAIEDAVVLGQCLRDVADPTRAFETYEGLRRGRVEKVVAYSKRIGSTKAPGPVGRAIRDALMPVTLELFASETAHSWLYANRLEWNEKVASR